MSETEVAERPVFRTGVVIALVLVSVFAFSGFVTLAGLAPDLQRDLRCRANVYSQCAIGFAGLAEVLKNEGATVVISRTPLPKGRADGLMIATPEPEKAPDPAALNFEGPILMTMPKWEVGGDPNHPGWGMKEGLISHLDWQGAFAGLTVDRVKGLAAQTLHGEAGTPFDGQTLTTGKIDAFQVFNVQNLQTKGWAVVMSDAAGRPVIAQLPSSRVFVVSDPDLLNTEGLADADTFASAASVVRALKGADGPVIFDVTLNGYQLERSPLQLMFKPPFLAVTLCAAAAMALAGLQAFFRFGPTSRRERVFALGKEALTDNSAQLIRLAGREAKMAPGYAELTRKAAARAVGAPRELTGQALTDFLDRMGDQRGLPDNLATLTHEAGRVEGRPQLTALAERLYRWRLEMTRERQ